MTLPTAKHFSFGFPLACDGFLRFPQGMKKVVLPLVLVSALLIPAQAELPGLNEKPWLGYFVGIKDRKFQFGVTAKGEAILYPLKRDGSVQSLFNPIKINYEILETMPDGKVVSKRVNEESLTSEQPATEDPTQPVKIAGKVTGDAAFELVIASERSGFSISGKVTDNGTLTNPLRFAVSVAFNPHRSNGEKSESAQEKFEKELKREEIKLTLTNRDREKVEFLEKVNLAQKFPDGFTTAELDTEGYGGVEFQLEAVGPSKIVFEDKGEQEVWKGIPFQWSVNADGDPSQSKLVITAK